MRCNACGFENRPGLRFCENCGASLPQPAPPPPAVPTGRFCPNCGTHNPTSARFCKNCSYSFAGYAPSQPIYAPTPPPHQAGAPILLYILEAVGSLALIGAVLAGIYLLLSGRLALPTAPQVIVLTQPAPIVITQIEPPAEQPPIVITTVAPPAPIIITATLPPPTNPIFTANQDVLCRAGPSQAFDVQTSINGGQSVNIIGRSSPEWEAWWQVSVGGFKCWVWSGLGTTDGNVSSVPIVKVQVIITITPTDDTKFYSFVVFNNTGQDLCNLYRRYSGTSSWGQDLLMGWDGRWLSFGDMRTWSFPAGKYDFRAVGCSTLGGYDRVIPSVTIPDVGGVTFNR